MAMETSSKRHSGFVLACDGGATGLRAGLYDAGGTLCREAAAGPCNPVEQGIARTAALVARLVHTLGQDPIDSIVASIAGAGRQPIREALAHAMAQATGVRVRIADDLHPILLANACDTPAILAIAGTGSSVLAAFPESRIEIRIGGRGRSFGEDGSAYAVAVGALQAAARALDGMGAATRLTSELWRALGLAAFDDLVLYAAHARKDEIAGLARVVDRLASEGDAVAAHCIEEQALRLVEQTLAAQNKLGLPADTRVFISGGLFDGSAHFKQSYCSALRACWPDAEPVVPSIRGHAAALRLANQEAPLPTWISESTGTEPGIFLDTERRLHEAPPIDMLDTLEIVALMNHEDAGVPRAVVAASDAITETIEAVAKAFRAGGRLIYTGAGTSGRLGVLDASECPATFGTRPEQVVALIAGGETAIRSSVEGAEDDEAQARADIASMQPPIGPLDVVVGIAASGRTPYVRAALDEAHVRGACTALVACNPVNATAADIVIAMDTGPEVVAGSTRLKAGTATKMVLNMISTGAMVSSGRIYDGLMVGMRPVNAKLRRRAKDIVAALAPCEPAQASEYLEAAQDDIATAILMARTGVDRTTARERLERAHGNLRRALEES